MLGSAGDLDTGRRLPGLGLRHSLPWRPETGQRRQISHRLLTQLVAASRRGTWPSGTHPHAVVWEEGCFRAAVPSPALELLETRACPEDRGLGSHDVVRGCHCHRYCTPPRSSLPDPVCQHPEASVTKEHKSGALEQQTFFVSQPGGQKPRIKVAAGSCALRNPQARIHPCPCWLLVAASGP